MLLLTHHILQYKATSLTNLQQLSHPQNAHVCV